MPPAYDYSDKIWWMPDFSQDSGQGISNLLSGFMSGYNVAKERKTETAKVDALNEVAESDGSTSAPVARPPGNWFTDTIKGYTGIPAWQQEQADPIFDIKKRGAQVQLQGAELGVRAKQLELDGTAHDQQLMGQVMADINKNPNYLNELPGPIPFKTPQYQQVFDSMMLQNSRSLANRAKVADIAEFNKKVAGLSPENRAFVQKISPNKDGSPSPAQWQSLNLAEQTDQAAAENKAKLAEIEALQRGDTVTTTVRDSGAVTQTYRPPSASSQPVVPQEMTLSDGTRIVSNPKTGSFKIIAKTGEQKDMTSKQLMDITKALKEDRPDDPLVKKIEDFVLSQAAEQVERTTTTPTAPAPSSKVLKYNPQTGRIE